jgi:hypothetical protein
MTIEACFSPDVSLVRMKHVRAALGQQLHELEAVEIVVVAGELARQRVSLVRKNSGRGQHVAFQCPRCLEPRTILHAEGHGRLSCASCSGHKTRHQRESSRKDWKDNALEQEDRLFRAVLKKSHTPAGLRGLRRLVQEIGDGDDDRLAAALETTSAALLVADTRDDHPDR